MASETAFVDGGETVRVPRLLQSYLGDFGGRAGILRQLSRSGVVGSDHAPRNTFGSYDWTLALDEPRGQLGEGPDETDNLAVGP